MRTSCDVDILVRSNGCERSIELLKNQLSYNQIQSNSLHDFVLNSPSGVHVELHHTLIEDEVLPEANKILGNVWESSKLKAGFNYKYELSGEMFLYYHIVHMVKHFLSGGCGIRSMIDLWLISKNISFDDNILRYMLEKSKLIKFYDKAFDLTDVWFENKEYSKVDILFENYIVDGSTFGTYSNSAAILAGQGESKTVSFLRTMFLSFDNLTVLYPNLKKRPYLYPF